MTKWTEVYLSISWTLTRIVHYMETVWWFFNCFNSQQDRQTERMAAVDTHYTYRLSYSRLDTTLINVFGFIRRCSRNSYRFTLNFSRSDLQHTHTIKTYIKRTLSIVVGVNCILRVIYKLLTKHPACIGDPASIWDRACKDATFKFYFHNR